MKAARVRLAEGGTVAIPREYRDLLDLHEGDELVVRLDDGVIKIVGLGRAIQNAQDLVRRFVPEGRSLVDELIAERRREAERG